MRHRVAHRKLNRTSAHRRALRRNMAQSLFEHGQVRTTVPKAKDLRPFAERLITLAKRAADLGQSAAARLTARRRLHQLLGDRAIIPQAHRDDYDKMSDSKRDKVLRGVSGRRYRAGAPKGPLAFTAESVLHRLIESIASRYQDRPGGYTRIIRLADRRIGDHAPLAILQLVGDEESPGSISKPKRTTRRRKADGRYAFAVKLAKQAAGRARGGDGTERPAESVAAEEMPEVPADGGAGANAE